MSAVTEELRRILDRDGVLSPEAVVKAAKNPRSPLHSHFEWDDNAASNMWRLEQARHLIKRVRVTIQPDEGSERTVRVRAYFPVGPKEYVSTVKALKDSALRQKVLKAAFRELAAFRTKYKDLKELADVIAAIDDVELLLEDVG